MDGFLKFKWLFIIHWAAVYSRVGFQNCRLPWACGPKGQKNVFFGPPAHGHLQYWKPNLWYSAAQSMIQRL